VAALGARGSLVGVTHECDEPPEVDGLPRVTRSAIDTHAPAAIVDAEVREASASGAPLFTLLSETIMALRPDLVLTQALCDVCAVSEADVRALCARLDPSPRVVTLAGETLDGVFADIQRVAEALGQAARGQALVGELGARVRAVHETLKAARAPRPRVAVIEWGAPLYIAGHWAPEMVKRAGGTPLLAQPGERSRVVTIGEVEAAAPEVVLFAPCGYGLERATEEGRRLREEPAWAFARGLSAFAVDANALVSRPGPRLVEGIEVFARLMNPALFSPPGAGRAVKLTR